MAKDTHTDHAPSVATVEQIKDSFRYSRVAIIALLFIIGGATFYHHVEHLSWLNSFYFTVITLATVGYGDIVPHTDAGKLFTIFYVFVGITIFVVLGRIVLTSAVRHRYYRQERKDKK